MKKLLFLLLLSFLNNYEVNSQVANYIFSQSNTTYTEISGGTVLGDTTLDEQRFVDPSIPLGDTASSGVGLSIGFNFTFNGSVFDVFAVNANGWISLGQSSQTPSVNMLSANYQTPISTTSAAVAELQNRIAVFGRNIAGQVGSELRYETIGTAPNRTLVVQWKGFRRNTTSVGENLNFQIRLNETLNTIDLVYGSCIYTGTNSTVQVGLRGMLTTDYNNRRSTNNWSATTAGIANTSAITISSTVFPDSSLTFTFTTPVYYPDDAGISAINLPMTPNVMGSKDVAVTIKNFGTDSLKSATIDWSVNDIMQTPFSFNHIGLLKDSVAAPDTLGVYNFNTTGYYTIKVWTSLPNGNSDGNNTNDTLTKLIYIQPFASIPFYENFDSTWTSKNDTNDVPSMFWKNTPAFGNGTWRRDDDTITANWTSNTGAYTPIGADNTIHSARFHSVGVMGGSFNGALDLYLDLSPSGGKLLDFFYINTNGNDSLSIYLSTDNGLTFTLIQKFLAVASWTQNFVNLGNSSSANCILRFKGNSANNNNSDIGIDEVKVYLQPDNEMAALNWVSPVSACGLGSNEQITVRVVNNGLLSQSNIPVKYSIDGGVTIVGPELIPGPVDPGDTATYTFNATADFSTFGIYQCGFVVELSGDAIQNNDSAFFAISSVSQINSFPFTENFNTGLSDYFMLSANQQAGISYDTLGTQSTYGLHFTGKTTSGWTSGNTSAVAAWNYIAHQSKAATCNVDATGVSELNMMLDLRQTSSNTNNMTYSWFAVVINGVDTLEDVAGNKFFNPLTAVDDVYTTKIFDLSAYANTGFTIKLIASCRRDLANSPSQTPDNVLVDNIILYAPPFINDLGTDVVGCNTYTLDAGAGSGYTYVWTTLPSGNVVGTEQTLIVEVTGTYYVVVTDASGFSAADVVNVTIVQPPVANAGNDTTIASGMPASLFGSTNPPSGPFTYSWTPANLLVDPTMQNPTTTALTTSAIFTLTVTDTVAGCTATDDVIVLVSGGALSLTASSTPDTICAGEAAVLLALPSGGSGNYTYNWCDGLPSASSVTASPSVTTTYTVTVSDGTQNASASVTVNVINCSGIADYNQNSMLYIFPNPSTGLTTFELTGINSNALLNIYSVLGDIIYSENIFVSNKVIIKQLDLSYLPKGVYIVCISNDKSHVIWKLILQ